MTLRLIVRHTDTSNMTPHGGTHVTSYRTFDIDHPEIERLLRDSGQYYQYQLIGAELLPKICPNCDSPLPEGCSGTFKGEPSCALHRVRS